MPPESKKFDITNPTGLTTTDLIREHILESIPSLVQNTQEEQRTFSEQTALLREPRRMNHILLLVPLAQLRWEQDFNETKTEALTRLSEANGLLVPLLEGKVPLVSEDALNTVMNMERPRGIPEIVTQFEETIVPLSKSYVSTLKTYLLKNPFGVNLSPEQEALVINTFSRIETFGTGDVAASKEVMQSLLKQGKFETVQALLQYPSSSLMFSTLSNLQMELTDSEEPATSFIEASYHALTPALVKFAQEKAQKNLTHTEEIFSYLAWSTKYLENDVDLLKVIDAQEINFLQLAQDVYEIWNKRKESITGKIPSHEAATYFLQALRGFYELSHKKVPMPDGMDDLLNRIRVTKVQDTRKGKKVENALADLQRYFNFN